MQSKGLSNVGSKCTHVAMLRTRVAYLRLFSKAAGAKIEVTSGAIARHHPREPATPG